MPVCVSPPGTLLSDTVSDTRMVFMQRKTVWHSVAYLVWKHFFKSNGWILL